MTAALLSSFDTGVLIGVVAGSILGVILAIVAHHLVNREQAREASTRRLRRL